MADSHGTHLFNQEEKNKFDLFVHQTKITIEKVETDFSWIKNLAGVL